MQLILTRFSQLFLVLIVFASCAVITTPKLSEKIMGKNFLAYKIVEGDTVAVNSLQFVNANTYKYSSFDVLEGKFVEQKQGKVLPTNNKGISLENLGSLSVSQTIEVIHLEKDGEKETYQKFEQIPITYKHMVNPEGYFGKQMSYYFKENIKAIAKGNNRNWDFEITNEWLKLKIGDKGFKTAVSEVKSVKYFDDGFKINFMNKNELYEIQFKNGDLKTKLPNHQSFIVRLRAGDRISEGVGFTLWNKKLEREWVLSSYKGVNVKDKGYKTKTTVKFDLIQNKIYGNTGCNYYRGSCIVNGDKITVGPLVMTKKACLRNNFETEFKAFFNGELLLSLRKDDLYLTNSLHNSCTFTYNKN